MQSANAIPAYATTLSIGDGATPTEAFTEIAEVTNIDGPGLSAEAVKVGVDSNGFAKYLIGEFDGGEVSLELNFVPTDATHGYSSGLLKDYASGTRRNFKLEFPDTANTTWSFAAYVTSFAPSAAAGSQLTASVTLKIDGKPTLA